MSTFFVRKISLAALIAIALAIPAVAQEDIVLLNKDGEKVGVAPQVDEKKTPPVVVQQQKQQPQGADRKPGSTSATLANGVITITNADGTIEEINLGDARSVTVTRSSQMVDENGKRKMKAVSKAIVIGPDGVRREITLGDNLGGSPVRTVKTPKTWMIGLSCSPVPALTAAQLKLEANTGLAVTRVLDGGAGQSAGVQVNDILLFVDQSTLGTNRELTDAVNEAGKNEQRLSLTLLRAGEEMTVSVTPTEREGVQQMMMAIGPEGFGGFGGARGLFVPELPEFDMEFRQFGPGLIIDPEGERRLGFTPTPAMKEMRERIEKMQVEMRAPAMKEMRERIEKMQAEMRAELEALRDRVRENGK